MKARPSSSRQAYPNGARRTPALTFDMHIAGNGPFGPAHLGCYVVCWLVVIATDDRIGPARSCFAVVVRCPGGQVPWQPGPRIPHGQGPTRGNLATWQSSVLTAKMTHNSMEI